MKLKVLFITLAMALVSAFTIQAQSQADIDNSMAQLAVQFNKQFGGSDGIKSVTYDKATHGLYVNIDQWLIDDCVRSNIPRSAIKSYIIEGIKEDGGSEVIKTLNSFNVKFGIRYTYKGKAYTDLFYLSDFK